MTHSTSAIAIGLDAACVEEEVRAASDSASLVAMNVRMVSGMMGEISRGASSIRDRVANARRHAGEALAETGQTAARARELTAIVVEIERTAQTIRGIANQTKMLSLNATLEAARAGAAGKGFAVVANEVKALARATEAATESINTQLGAVRLAAARVSQSVSVAQVSFDSIRELVDGAAVNLDEQDQTVSQIADYAEDAAKSVESIAGAFDRMSAFVTETARELSAVQALRDTAAPPDGNQP